MEAQEKYDAWHKDNPEDKRIFPPKRFKWMGWTINFADTKSVIAFVLFLVFVGWLILYTNFRTD
jgi:uncharacterized membrane protein